MCELWRHFLLFYHTLYSYVLSFHFDNSVVIIMLLSVVIVTLSVSLICVTVAFCFCSVWLFFRFLFIILWWTKLSRILQSFFFKKADFFYRLWKTVGHAWRGRRINCGEIIGKADPIDHDGRSDGRPWRAGRASLPMLVGHCGRPVGL